MKTHRIPDLFLFDHPDSREQAVYVCAMLALAYLETKAQSQPQRDELPHVYYWADDLARTLLAEASSRVLPHDTEVVGAVMAIAQLPLFEGED